MYTVLRITLRAVNAATVASDGREILSGKQHVMNHAIMMGGECTMHGSPCLCDSLRASLPEDLLCPLKALGEDDPGLVGARDEELLLPVQGQAGLDRLGQVLQPGLDVGSGHRERGDWLSVLPRWVLRSIFPSTLRVGAPGRGAAEGPMQGRVSNFPLMTPSPPCSFQLPQGPGSIKAGGYNRMAERAAELPCSGLPRATHGCACGR